MNRGSPLLVSAVGPDIISGNSIPSFMEELTQENRLTGFHHQLASILLLFSAYVDIGIKTTLGMGE